MMIHQVESTALTCYNYIRSTRELFVTFKSGHTYVYTGVNPGAFLGLCNAHSKGRQISKIKTLFPYRKVI